MSHNIEKITNGASMIHLKPLPRIILVFALVLLTALFFLGGPDFYSARSFKAFWNIGHIVYYALLPFAIFTFTAKRPLRPAAQVVIGLGLALVLGIMVELAQSSFQRTPDAGDIVRNLIGALVGIFFLLPVRETIPRRSLRLLQTAALILAASQIYPIAVAITDEYRVERQFPILSSFETPYEIQRWQGDAKFSVDDDIAATGRHAMRIAMTKNRYSGVNLRYFHENWTGYKWLQMMVYNPSPGDLVITCRIHDQLHIEGTQSYEDRYNQQFTLSPGWNPIQIDLDQVRDAPARRQMDMRHIRGLGLFAARLPHPQTIYIDDILLKKS